MERASKIKSRSFWNPVRYLVGGVAFVGVVARGLMKRVRDPVPAKRSRRDERRRRKELVRAAKGTRRPAA